MKFSDLFSTVEQFIPLFAGLTGHPELGMLAQKLISIGESEVQRRMAATGKTRAEVLADASATWQQLKIENDELKKLGHEADG